MKQTSANINLFGQDWNNAIQERCKREHKIQEAGNLCKISIIFEISFDMVTKTL